MLSPPILNVPPINFRTRTPKGDGNRAFSPDDVPDEEGISEHEPRKGTETASLSALRENGNGISEHEPRKGTETSASDLQASSFFAISEHEPRKGTETKLFLHQFA